MRSRWAALLFVSLRALAGCGSSGEDSSTKEPAGSDGGDQNATAGESDDTPSVEIVDFGFGQSDSSAQAMVVVTTDSESAMGEFVTVTANFLDADGQIIATEEQVESFNWVGQELAMPVWLYLDDKPNAKVASIEPSVGLSDYGMSEPEMAPLPVLEATEISKGEYGGYSASFGFTNETDGDLQNLRVGVVCYDAGEKIIGGTTTYPELAPQGKTIRIDADLTVSGKPASCKAFLNYDV